MTTRMIVKRGDPEAFRHLPFCMRCGEPGARLVEVTLAYSARASRGEDEGEDGPAGAGAPGVGRLWDLLDLETLFSKLGRTRQVRLVLPLCPGHERAARRRASWLPFGTWLLGGLAALFCLPLLAETGRLAHSGASANVDGDWAYGLFVLALLCAAGAFLCRAWLRDGFLYPVRVTEEEVDLGGVAESFFRRALAGPHPPQVRWAWPETALSAPAPPRARRLQGLGTFSLLAGIGLLFVTSTAISVASGPRPPAPAFFVALALGCLAFLALPLAAWVVARRDLARMRRGLVFPPGTARTALAFRQGRFAAVLCLLSSLLAAAALLVRLLRG